MAWYNVGTVTVTNGSTIVTGAGTDFINNVTARDALLVSAGVPLEIAAVTSATQLTLAKPWLAATAAGQTYTVLPTVGIYVDLALRALNMLTPFQAVLDGIGQGLIPAGTVAAPGIRFAVDQDTGIRRTAENQLALVTGGADRLGVDDKGAMTILTATPGAFTSVLVRAGSTGEWSLCTQNGLATGETGTLKARFGLFYTATGAENATIDFMRGGNASDGLISFRTGAVERMRVDNAGNLLVGVTAYVGNCHVLLKGTTQGDRVFYVTGLNHPGTTFFSGAGASYSTAATCMTVPANTTTGRSISTAGTINASGADYAEYMTKADGCGTIAAGDVCGVDAEGKLTRIWSAAVSFVVKSTDPAYVGGDTWAAGMPPKPEAPGTEPAAPIAPVPPTPAGAVPVFPVREEGEDDAAYEVRVIGFAGVLASYQAKLREDVAYRDALAAFPALLADYQAAHAEWEAATAQHAADLSVWEADLEAARHWVDRIAFAGQVPVNIIGEFAVGDYLVAAANGGGIQAIAVPEAEITFDQYRRRLGKVWAIRGDQPWIDVQHG
jgi:hypothetical protein